MTYVLMVMTDGRRDCIARTIPSALSSLVGQVTRKVIHDDSGDPDYRRWLVEQFPYFEIVSTGKRSGFGGAYRSAWSWLSSEVDERWVVSIEDDFLFPRPVELDRMTATLVAHPKVAQMALRRQPWNAAEVAAGGVVEMAPGDFADRRCTDGSQWLEHHRFWTTNPSLHSVSLCRTGWPEDPQSEGRMTHRLLAEGRSFGYWGARDSGVWVEHIGNTRIGTGY